MTDRVTDKALEQIADRHYDRELEDDNYTVISHYGIAFRGKECAVKWAIKWVIKMIPRV